MTILTTCIYTGGRCLLARARCDPCSYPCRTTCELLRAEIDPRCVPRAELCARLFPDGADDTLADALEDAGWSVDFVEGQYLYRATHGRTRALLSYVEGDLYDGDVL